MIILILRAMFQRQDQIQPKYSMMDQYNRSKSCSTQEQQANMTRNSMAARKGISFNESDFYARKTMFDYQQQKQYLQYLNAPAQMRSLFPYYKVFSWCKFVYY